MFGGNSSRRKSFFFFGSNNEPVPSPSNGQRFLTTSVSKRPPETKSSKQKSNVRNPIRSLDMKPLKQNKVKDSSPTMGSLNTSSKDIQRVETTPDNQLTNQKFNNIYQNDVRKVSGMRRPPPPAVDMSLLNSPTPASSVKNDTTFKQDDTISSEVVIVIPTVTPFDNNTEIHKHRRQRSEAEKLVDDIDLYITEHQKSVSPAPLISELQDEEDSNIGSPIESLKLCTTATSGTSGTSVEYGGYVDSASEVNPLVTSHYASKDIHSGLSISKGETNYITDVTSVSDGFSFSNTVDGNSVHSIQQVRINDDGDTVPVITSHGYTTYNKSDEGDDNVYNDDVYNYDNNYIGYSNYENFRNANPDYDNDIIKINTTTSNEQKSIDYSEEHLKKYIVDNSQNFTGHEVSLSGTNSFGIVGDGNAKFFLGTGHNSASSSTNEEYTTNSSLTNKFHDGIMQPENFCTSQSNSLTNDIKWSKNHIDLDSIAISSVGCDDGPPQSRESIESINSFIKPTASNISNSDLSATVSSPRRDTNVSMVSSYVEELRLKYYTTSNFLEAPPNLPLALKQKNNLVQSRNVKVTIRTSSKQIGIKHGRVKQKLLALETTNEEGTGSDSIEFVKNKNKIVDHTKEFHELMNRKDEVNNKIEGDDLDSYLNDIPGDDAYNSDDAMAPLRETDDQKNTLTRNNTNVSYYTKNKRRLRSGTLDNSYAYLQKLPSKISIKAYQNAEEKEQMTEMGVEESRSIGDDNYTTDNEFEYKKGLHIVNPDSGSE